MKVSEFNFDLPEELIAKYPTEKRSASRLLHVDPQQDKLEDLYFYDIVDLINENDLLIFNDTKVIAGRLFGQKASGGKVELLVERVLNKKTILAHIKSSRSPKENSQLYFDNGFSAMMIGRHDNLFELRFEGDVDVFSILEEIGHVPLPPYIDREDEQFDEQRYQTVYADKLGAVAAPTAGLHFDDTILSQFKAKKVDCAYITLHVGAGTFMPVKVDDITSHKMHSEYIEISQTVVDKIIETKKNNGRVIAVGTTSVRTLETAAREGIKKQKLISPYYGETDIFLYPGQPFYIVDAMITNFHLPQSTLIMLVSAFAGQTNIMDAYRHAIEKGYRFFSYGDAMFIQPQ